MIIYPAIDLYQGKAVRLYKGDYNEMTVYSDNPPELARAFAAAGATHMHIVDLEGAKSGTTPNLDTVLKIKEAGGLFCEIGGGIRTDETVARYLDAGLDRVILGSAAVTDEAFLCRCVEKYGEKIAVGIDIRDGFVAIHGWTEKSSYSADEFCRKIQKIGVKTIICTDISRDGAMRGTNLDLYRKMQSELSLDIIASGGVSSLSDVRALAQYGLYGAIIGKAYYTGAIELATAIREAK